MTGGETKAAELGDGGRTPEEDGGLVAWLDAWMGGGLLGWWTCAFRSAEFHREIRTVVDASYSCRCVPLPFICIRAALLHARLTVS